MKYYMGAIQTIPFNAGDVLPSQPKGVRGDKANWKFKKGGSPY